MVWDGSFRCRRWMGFEDGSRHKLGVRSDRCLMYRPSYQSIFDLGTSPDPRPLRADEVAEAPGVLDVAAGPRQSGCRTLGLLTDGMDAFVNGSDPLDGGIAGGRVPREPMPQEGGGAWMAGGAEGLKVPGAWVFDST
ncbi:hypothetical protein CLAIMM_14712 [Cladophialophora immunda]|nr:hypothetical protein CLAIMM_14712 [Cladophialophora immunda]